LAHGELLAEKFRNYQLTGNYVGAREYHIEPDWLLIYEATPVIQRKCNGAVALH